MGSIAEVLHDRAGVVVVAIFVILLVLVLVISGSARAQFKNAVLLLVTITVLASGYYYITGSSVTEIPHQINTFFNDPQAPETTSHRYYRDPVLESEKSLGGEGSQ